jgi:hypothetical protein
MIWQGMRTNDATNVRNSMRKGGDPGKINNNPALPVATLAMSSASR